MYYFTRNLDWPQDNLPTFNIGYFQEDLELKPELERLARSKKIQKKKVKLIALTAIEELSGKNLHMVYLNAKRSRKLKAAKKLTDGTTCLLVSNKATDKRQVFINMIQMGNTLGFEIYKSNITSRGLKIGANLLLIGGKEVDVRELYIESAKSLRSEKEKVEQQRKLIAQQENEMRLQKGRIEKQKKDIEEQKEQISTQNEELVKQQERLNAQRAELAELMQSIQKQKQQFLQKQLELDTKSAEISKQHAEIGKNKEILKQLEVEGKKLQQMNSQQKKSLQQKDLVIDSKEETILYSFIFLAITATLVILAALAYIGKRRANQKLRKQKEHIEHQNAEIQQRNEEVSAQRDELAKQNAEIQQQKEEIESQKDELLRQKEIVEQQNYMITGSIRYAQTIQQAILPPAIILDKSFENFVLFWPKDIVSGDFYWHLRIEEKGAAYDFFAVVDCTGHGVPGAFMSMIGSRVLNMLVNERGLRDPADILEGMDFAVQRSLRQEQTDNRDGMEVGLVKVSTINGRKNVEFAGARRPLMLYQNKGNELIKFTGCMRGIAGPLKKSKRIAFSTAKISTEPGDVIYLSSDGFKDQNNRERKRFGSQSFMRIIQTIGHLSLAEQQKIFEKALKEHMNGAEQRDDITVAGIRV